MNPDREHSVTFGELCAGIFAIGAVAVWLLLIVYAAWHFAVNALITLVPM